MWRTLRMSIAVLCFSGFLLLFLDLSGTLSPHLAFLGKMQLVPALLSGSVAVVLALLALTLLLGRVYCSTLCPLGVMQDAIARLSRLGHLVRLGHVGGGKGTHRFAYRPNRPALRAAALLLFAAALLAGVPVVFGLLEPYSAFGRIATGVLHPVATLGNNALALAAQQLDSVAVAPSPLVQRGLSALLGAVLTLGLVGWLAWKGGRIWCNTLCPVGTALGLVGRFALLRPRLNAQKCVGCGLCAARCKASCIDVAGGKVDASRCVACFNCQGLCKQGALTFAPEPLAGAADRPRAASDVSTATAAPAAPTLAAPATATVVTASGTRPGSQQTTRGSVNHARRSLLTGLLASTAAALPAHAAKRGEDVVIPALTRKQRPTRTVEITPPGSQNVRHFAALCTGCQLCVSACPHQVLRAGDSGAGMLQPVMSFEHGFCRVNCVACTNVCPTGALRPLSVEEKSATQMGHVVVRLDLCIVNSDKVRCTACSRNCPPAAITLVGEGELQLPAVDNERCTGCGACEYVCPARPLAAIRVEGNAQHRRI